METVKVETGLMQSDWVADGLTLWTVELISVPLTQGIATYSVPGNVVEILDMYINNGSSDRLIFPFSRTDYSSIANKTNQGFPTVFWHDRLLSSTFTLWPVPDGNATYTSDYYAYTTMQDSVLSQGGQAAIPAWWLDAWTAGLAHRLSRHYAPTLEAARKVDAMEAYAKASKQFENTPMYINPDLTGFFRN
jgi:hypothetical protein